MVSDYSDTATLLDTFRLRHLLALSLRAMPFNTKLTRRTFLAGCSAFVAAQAGSRLSNLAFAVGEAEPEVLISVFLRGGWDALNVVPPMAVGPDNGYYVAARPGLKLASSGTNPTYNLDGFFGLHPSMGPLYSLYQAQRLAFVHACGLTYDTRSHFDAQAFIELGTPGAKNSAGWMSRYLETLALPSNTPLPALSAGSSRAMTLQGFNEALAMSNPSSFNVSNNTQYRGQQINALRAMYGSNADWLDQAGKETVDAIDLIASKNLGTYAPSNGATYPTGSFGDNLKLIAQMIKLGVGLTAATVDLGGWDTHENQGTVGQNSQMGNLLNTLSRGLEAFHIDLESCNGSTDYNNKVTLTVISEFGRRLKENANAGTDHGHGSVMLVMGKNIKGGKVYGQWPGLANDQLYQRADLAITTDYRRVLSEIMRLRTGRTDAQLNTIFPGYTQQPDLGLVRAASDPATTSLCYKRMYMPLVRR
jgi:uncharacterized protein (DUF1501 family)